MAARDDVNAQLVYLEKNDLFETEKPYNLQYKPDDETLLRTNCARVVKSDILIRDFRDHENKFSIEKQGFEIMKLESEMQYADFDSDEMVENIYYPELKASLRSRFKPRRIEILEHIVSSSPDQSINKTSNCIGCRSANATPHTPSLLGKITTISSRPRSSTLVRSVKWFQTGPSDILQTIRRQPHSS